MDQKKSIPKFGYILGADDLRKLSNFKKSANRQIDNGNSSSAGPSPSHSPVSVKEFQTSTMNYRQPPQQTALKIDSYSRKTNHNYLKNIPKTEKQRSRIQRIAQLDDAIFDLEQLYRKLKLSDQDLLDRAERRDLPYIHQLLRYNNSSPSQLLHTSSPTQFIKSDEEFQQQNRINRLEQIELKRRPISAFYTQFQRAPPMRRSARPDLIGDDQAVRRLNPPTSKPTNLNSTVAPSYLQTTAAYANPPNLEHQKKRNVFGHLEFDPIVDDVQYRKMNKESTSNQLPPNPPHGIPLNANILSKANPINDYMHSAKTNDMAVRKLRKDYSVNQSNPFANVLHRSSSQSAFFQQQREDDLLPETTSNYLANVKKQLKPTRSLTYSVSNIDQQNDLDVHQTFDYNNMQSNQQQLNSAFKQNQIFNNNRFSINKSSSLSNCLLNKEQDKNVRLVHSNAVNDEQTKSTNKPKNNIYKKQQAVRTMKNDEEQLENMLSNLNEIRTKQGDRLISDNRNENKFVLNQKIQRSPTQLMNDSMQRNRTKLEQREQEGNKGNNKDSIWPIRKQMVNKKGKTVNNLKVGILNFDFLKLLALHKSQSRKVLIAILFSLLFIFTKIFKFF